ncbi:MAG: leucine-rich repeat domain-containing protein [Rikenellaceae bacterium]
MSHNPNHELQSYLQSRIDHAKSPSATKDDLLQLIRSLRTIAEEGRKHIGNIDKDGVKFCTDNARLIDFNNNFKHYHIPDGTLIICREAISWRESLTSITMPNSLIIIGEAAFACCDYLESVEIGDSVAVIGEAAFCGCFALKNINIPNSILAIEKHAFKDCESLQTITIPDSVKLIDEAAFEACDKLESIIISPKSPLLDILKERYADIVVVK